MSTGWHFLLYNDITWSPSGGELFITRGLKETGVHGVEEMDVNRLKTVERCGNGQSGRLFIEQRRKHISAAGLVFFTDIYSTYYQSFYSCWCAVRPGFSSNRHLIPPKSSFWIVCWDPDAFSGPWKWIIFAAWLSCCCIVAVQLCIEPQGNQCLISWKL